MTNDEKREIRIIVDEMLSKFKERYLSFRSRLIRDTPTDAKQVAVSGDVSQSVQQYVMTYVASQLAGYLQLSGGSLDDGANIGLGDTTGTQFGTGPSQKMAFYGGAPIVQQANTAGDVTAGATYTSTEQAMLNDCYSVLRNLGLLS